MLHRLLFAIDFFSCARHAEPYVKYLARASRALVEVRHVMNLYEGTVVTTIQQHEETDRRFSNVVENL
jgi:hypothetical protein